MTSLYTKFIGGDNTALTPNLRGVAYAVVARTSTDPEAVYAQVMHIYKTAKSNDQKLVALGSLGSTSSIAIAKVILEEFALNLELGIYHFLIDFTFF